MNSRPNLLLITTDQQRFDTVHRAGNGAVMTPHLDWMADTGVLFRRAYSDAPICCAARATMITGRHYYRMGDFGNWGQPTAPDSVHTLPAILTRSGYQTRAVGKMHYDPPRCHYGFEHMEILEDYYRHARQFPGQGIPMDHGMGQNEMEPAISTIEESRSLTRWTVTRAVDFLETRDHTRPFFLNVGFSKPHPPFDPCLNYWHLYDAVELPAPVYGDWSKDPAQIPPAFMMPTWNLNGADRLDQRIIRQVRRAYYACITQIDYNLGYLFARMREMGLLENTLIIFTSDHGEMLGDHHMGGKTTMLEGSAHVPMLMCGPRELIPESLCNTQSDALVCLADIMPTFLDTAGVSPEQHPPMDGIDLLDVLHGRRAPRQQLVGAYRDHYCIIEDCWKYLYSHIGGPELLFNLKDDPQECLNLAGRSEGEAIRKRLRRQLAATLHAAGRPVAVGDDLQVLTPAPSPEECRVLRTRRWPGFHSRDYTKADVLH
jgi:arylsulfatase A-like enzyme